MRAASCVLFCTLTVGEQVDLNWCFMSEGWLLTGHAAVLPVGSICTQLPNYCTIARPPLAILQTPGAACSIAALSMERLPLKGILIKLD